MSDSRQHWNSIFDTRAEQERSWTQANPATSISIIERLELAPGSSLVDIGGGASRLVDHLVAAGKLHVSVLDVSPAALCQARSRVGVDAAVTWIEADITSWQPSSQYTVWHDRAVFHFLTEADDQDHYRRIAADGVQPGGHLVLATFAPDGPERCSGLPVRRWSATDLVAHFEREFDAVWSEREEHHTPGGAVQPFTWVVLRRRSA